MNYPRYVSHKEVSAAKISKVELGADGTLIVELEGGFDKVTFSHHERKHKPLPEMGWYLVQYADGHQSFSPGDVFEQGYTPIGGTDDPPQIASATTASESGPASSLGKSSSDEDADDESGDSDEDDEEDEVEETQEVATAR